MKINLEILNDFINLINLIVYFKERYAKKTTGGFSIG